MPDIELLGAIYPDVPAVDLPKSGGGTARFYDVSGALCTITVEKDGGEEVYTSDKTAQQVYDALEVGINPVFRFHDLRDNADAYIYAALDSLQNTANGYELILSAFQIEPMTAATLSDYFELTIAPPVEKTVSGSIIHITDALAEPAIALSAAINPVQDLHGYSNPWPAGGGKNLFKPIDSPIEKNGVKVEMTSDGEFWVHGTPTIQSGNIVFNLYTFTFTPALDKTVTLSISEKTVGVGVNIGSGNGNLNLTLSDTVTYKTGTYTQGLGEVRINVRYDVGTIDKKYKIQLEISGSPTAWTPYSNICPITGWDEANIAVSPTQDDQDGTTYTVSFGSAGTVYGGTLDVVNGTLTVTHGQIASYAGEALPGAWISDRDAYAVGTTPTTGAQVVYELASAQTYTLTPTEVQLLLGTNNVWSDTGDTTLTYLADGRVNSLTALNMLLGNMYTPSADVSDREALQIIMGESE